MKNKLVLLHILLLSTSVNAQTGWFPLPDAPHSRQFYSIYFINADTGFVSSYEGNFKTTDGGGTWTPMEVYGLKFKFFNHNKLGFSIGGVWQTTDSGSTWQFVRLRILDIDFPSDSIGYSVGYSADTSRVSFGKTTNGGESWFYKNILPVTPRMRVVDAGGLVFRDDLHGFVTVGAEAQDGSAGGKFGFYTSDGGKTWNPRTGGDILFLHDSTWLWTSLNGTTYKTDDDFKNGRYVGKKIPPDACGFLGGHLCKVDGYLVSSFDKQSGAIYRSTDAGETWYFQRCGTTNWSNIDEGDITTPTRLVGYVVGIDSQIYKTIDGGGPPFTSGVIHSPIEAQSFDILSNPIASSADFQFSPLEEPKVLELFDLLGRSFLRRELLTGQVSIHVDMQAFPAGIYFARLGGKSLKVVKM